MACKGCENARKRFYVDGVPSAALDVHARHLKTAKELLDVVKSSMGLGGLKQLSHRYTNEDGVKFTASSRGGVDEVTIDVPRSLITEEPVEKKTEEEFNAYLWVGARIRYDLCGFNVPYGGFALMVIEPGAHSLVIDSQTAWWNPDGATYLREPLFRFPTGAMPDVDLLDTAAQDADWATYWDWVSRGRGLYVAKDWTQEALNTQVFTKHLLRHYSTGQVDKATAGLNLIQQPHDPKETADEIAARVFPPDYFDGRTWARTKWDQVVVLDPDEGGAEPTSRRPQDKAALRLMSAATGIGEAACVLTGKYIVKVVALGPACRWSTTDYPYNTNDYNENVTEYYDPLVVEVEVRVGKSPGTVTKNAIITLDAYAQSATELYPFGDHSTPSSCYKTDNPMGEAWWQGAFLADVKGGSIVQVDRSRPDVFGSPTALPPSCIRQYWDVYVQIFQPWCVYADGMYADEAARQVYELMALDVRQGIYGQLDLPAWSQDEVTSSARSVIPQTLGEGLYYYNPSANVFTGPIGYTIGGATSGNPNTDYQWEDDFRQQSISLCRGFAKVKLGMGNPVYDANIYAGDPQVVKDAANACAECENLSNPAVWNVVGAP